MKKIYLPFLFNFDFYGFAASLVIGVSLEGDFCFIGAFFV